MPQEYYQRSHGNGLLLIVCIHEFVVLSTTFHAGILFEIRWQWTESRCIYSLISDCVYYFSCKDIIRDHMRMDWISMYEFTYFPLYILLFPQEYYQRSHENGLNLALWIQLFPIVNITFVATKLSEITYEWTGSQCMDSHISDCKYYFSGKNIIKDHMAMDWISVHRFTYSRLWISLFPQEYYQRSHGNGLNLNVSIHLFSTVNITFVARILSEITWEWTGSKCMDSIISDCKYYFCRKNIIRDHMRMDWISIYGFKYFRL